MSSDWSSILVNFGGHSRPLKVRLIKKGNGTSSKDFGIRLHIKTHFK